MQIVAMVIGATGRRLPQERDLSRTGLMPFSGGVCGGAADLICESKSAAPRDRRWRSKVNGDAVNPSVRPRTRQRCADRLAALFFVPCWVHFGFTTSAAGGLPAAPNHAELISASSSRWSLFALYDLDGKTASVDIFQRKVVARSCRRWPLQLPNVAMLCG